jgi:protein required for attachment to host cells
MSDITLNNNGWLVIADGEKALFLRNDGDEKFPNLTVFREMEHENPATREQAADRPGRLNDGGGSHRSAVQETDWHRIEKERFAKELAELLYKHAHKGKLWRDRPRRRADRARQPAQGTAQGSRRQGGRRSRQGPHQPSGARDRKARARLMPDRVAP